MSSGGGRVSVGRTLEMLGVLAVALAAWEAFVRFLGVPKFVLPSPTDIFSATLAHRNYLLSNTLDTFYHALVGMAAAAGFSMALSLALAYSERARELVHPIITGFNAIPKAALVPLLALWFGLGSLPRVLTAFLTAFFPILVPTLTAMVTVERELWELLSSFGASRGQVLLKVAVPRSMPYFLSSLHMGLAGAVVGTVVAEMIASDRGLGYVILSSTTRLDTPLAFSCLMLLVVVSLALSKALSIVERRAAGWAYR